MYSWEIVCIEVDEESKFDDCRAITELGYRAPSLKKVSANAIGAKIHQDHSMYHITVDGERVPLQAAKDPDVHFYTRTLDEDSTNDPLIEMVSCTRYEMDEHLKSVK